MLRPHEYYKLYLIFLFIAFYSIISASLATILVMLKVQYCKMGLISSVEINLLMVTTACCCEMQLRLHLGLHDELKIATPSRKKNSQNTVMDRMNYLTVIETDKHHSP